MHGANVFFSNTPVNNTRLRPSFRFQLEIATSLVSYTCKLNTCVFKYTDAKRGLICLHLPSCFETRQSRRLGQRTLSDRHMINLPVLHYNLLKLIVVGVLLIYNGNLIWRPSPRSEEPANAHPATYCMRTNLQASSGATSDCPSSSLRRGLERAAPTPHATGIVQFAASWLFLYENCHALFSCTPPEMA
jgi:hypothetical protein